MRLAGLVGAAVVGLGLLASAKAEAFCGFYVAGSDQQLVNDATQVVLMRLGTRTVLSMQNHYKGPPEAFAMVVPVPTVLQEADVKTLDRGVFAAVDRMGAPRLVEYWEQDPCLRDDPNFDQKMFGTATGRGARREDAAPAKDLGVTVEAKFTVGEYQIVILSAKFSAGLDAWLRQEKYTIPKDAEPLLRPYVEQGMKFFVAKVDPAKVKWTGEGDARRAELSPLRFHYDSDDFTLPIRLGLANSSGTQDLIVNILAPRTRYQVTNYANVTIPTNIDVSPQMRDQFGAFYAALFDRTVEKHPGAVVTEYAWQATTCDPCPGPALGRGDFQTLGADVLGGSRGQPAAYPGADFVLTRLHARYGKTIRDDLRFAEAPPIAGGREHLTKDGGLEEGATASSVNNFQGRYAIRHPWTGPIRCSDPRRGRWGGPPREVRTQPDFVPAGVQPALELAYAPRGQVALEQVVKRDVPELGIRMQPVSAPPAPTATPTATPRPAPTEDAARQLEKGGCGCQGGASDSSGLLAGLGLLAVRFRRRRPARGAGR